MTAQEHTTSVLQRTLQSSNLPHMLFYGPPGTGKTSTILALSKQLFGPELMKTRVLELNASDERGINIVRQKVKDFARIQLSNSSSASQGGKYPCPPFKLVILDEADSMTADAQAALRRTIETYAKITRFCLVCNYVTRIIDPLASRCAKFRFKKLNPEDACRRVEEIAKLEGVRLEDGASDTLIACADGDLRRAVTFLQSAAKLAGAVGKSQNQKGKNKPDDKDGDDEDDAMDIDSSGSSVSSDMIKEIAGTVPDKVLRRLLQSLQPPPSKKGTGLYESISVVVTDLVADGWSAAQIVTQLYDLLLRDEQIPDVQKNQIVMVFSEVDKRLVDGADEHLAVLDLALRTAGIMAAA